MKAKLLSRIKEAYSAGIIEAVIWEVPEPVPPSEHRIKYRLVYVVEGIRVVGYDNERGKGDHKHLLDKEVPYVFCDTNTLIQDFLQDIREIER
jgi:hypothetical protein